MQYVRSLGGSVSKTWNSINPATLSGAIDVIVVEQEDGSLACSPFHVRFGKFSLLRPYEKKVEFKVNNERQDFPMKLGEGGEAFFVFETSSSVPEALQTSPLVSPATSPQVKPDPSPTSLSDPPVFELDSQPDTDPLSSPDSAAKTRSSPSGGANFTSGDRYAKSDVDNLTPLSNMGDEQAAGPASDGWPLQQIPSRLERAATDNAVPIAKAAIEQTITTSGIYSNVEPATSTRQMDAAETNRSVSPPPLGPEDAMTRAINLSKKLWTSNIASQVTEKGDIMLDMTGYKSSEDEALRAEVIARKILSEELEGDYDIGSLIGADENGNLWIYSSEETRDNANRKAASAMGSLQASGFASADALSDPGYASDDSRSQSSDAYAGTHVRSDSDSALGLSSASATSENTPTAGDPNRNYAKTLRLTSAQLESLNLKPGSNSMSFSVNRATCTANIYRWRYDVPIVISDIDGTITKSDALGHVLNMIGRDWTHLGVAKLYTEIAANGYNIMYLTSRSTGQADTTRGYLAGVVQDGGYKLPRGPVIMSPDRTIAALRREVYLRKPEVFKMACLRDIMALFTGSKGSNNAATLGPTTSKDSPTGIVGGSRGKGGSPFYAGFGNRLTDALSYRSVNIPSTRIFTINSNAEVSLDLLTLNKYKTGYSSMREIVDHYFPPVGLLVKGGGEEFTDFNYWREKTLDIVDFSDSESDSDDDDGPSYGRGRRASQAVFSEDEGDGMADSYLSEARTRDSEMDPLEESMIAESIEDPENYIDEDDDDDEEEDDDEDEDEEYDEEDEDDTEQIRSESIVVRPSPGSDRQGTIRR